MDLIGTTGRRLMAKLEGLHFEGKDRAAANDNPVEAPRREETRARGGKGKGRDHADASTGSVSRVRRRKAGISGIST